MKLIALMLVRNEERFLNFTARVALEWVDCIVFYIHNCTDSTLQIIEQLDKEFPDRISYLETNDPEWKEMDLRQAMLEHGRILEGTHFAMIDADEAITANVIFNVRGWVEALSPVDVLELPMVATWRSLYNYRDDSSVWSRSWISLAFKDSPDRSWRPDSTGYQHHSRTPSGIESRKRMLKRGEGGIFHMQWIDWDWLKIKQTWYAMKDLILHQERGIERIGKMYGESVDETRINLTPVPQEWHSPYRNLINFMNTNCVPWQKAECDEMIERYGISMFAGLEKYGLLYKP